MRGAFWIRFGLPAIGVVWALFALLTSLGDSATPGEVAFTLVPPAIVVIAGIWFLYWGSPWLSARQLSKHDPSVRGELHHIITEQGFGIRTVAASVDLTWAHVVQVVETSEFFLFYFRKAAAYATPKHAIPSEDLPRLRSSLGAWVGSRARTWEVTRAAA